MTSIVIPTGSSMTPSFYYSDTRAGSPTLTASNPTLIDATATIATTPAAATSLAYTTPPPTTTSTGTKFSVVVAEQDQYGNVETTDSSTNVTLAATGGSGFSCSTHSPARLASGTVTFSNCSYSTSGSSYTLTASAGSLTPATASTTVVGPPSKLVYTTPPPASTSPGTPFTVVVTEQDASGNTEAGDSTTSLTLHANNGGGGFSCTTDTDQGHQRRRDVLAVQLHHLQRNGLHADGVLGWAHLGDGHDVRREHAEQARLHDPAARRHGANTLFTVVVAEQDNFGNTVTTDSTTAVTLAANNGGGGFACTTRPAHVTNGVATFTGCSYTIASGTAYTLTASSAGLTSATANTTVAGIATKLVYTTAPPTSTAAGTPFSVVVAEQDTFGNTETTDSSSPVNLAANNGGGGFSCSVTPTKVTNGVATFTGCAYTVASGTSYTLTASSGVLTPATASTTVTIGPAFKLVYTTAPPGHRSGGQHLLGRRRRAGRLGQHRDRRLGDLGRPGGQQRRRRVQLHHHTDASHQRRRDVLGLQLHDLQRNRLHADGVLGWARLGDGDDDRLARAPRPSSSTRPRRRRRPPPGTTFSVVVAEQDAYGNTETGDSHDHARPCGQQRRRRLLLHRPRRHT